MNTLKTAAFDLWDDYCWNCDKSRVDEFKALMFDLLIVPIILATVYWLLSLLVRNAFDVMWMTAFLLGVAVRKQMKAKERK